MNTELDTRKEPNVASQNGWLLRQLKSGRHISALHAVTEAGIYRLAARVHNLRSMGHDVKTHTVHLDGRYWAVYYMEAE